MPKITSNQNPKIKLARSLLSRKHRDKTGLFLVEGLHHVGEALAAGAEIEYILYCETEDQSSYNLELLAQITNKSIPYYSVTKKIYISISAKENVQSFIAVVKQINTNLEDLENVITGVGLINPQNPGNIGAILRTIDAVNADVLFLIDGGADPYHPNCVRASMGTLFWNPIIRINFDEFIEYIQQNKINLYGTTAKEGQDFQNFKYNQPSVLLMGSEQKGLSEHHKAFCDVLLTIKMRGRVSSLNLSIATSILLYSIKND